MTSSRKGSCSIALLFAVGVVAQAGCRRQPKVTLPNVPQGAVDAHGEPVPPPEPQPDASPMDAAAEDAEGAEAPKDTAPDVPSDVAKDLPVDGAPDAPADGPAAEGPGPDAPAEAKDTKEAATDAVMDAPAEPPPTACFPSPAAVPPEVTYGWTRIPSGRLGHPTWEAAGALAVSPVDGAVWVGGHMAMTADLDPSSTEDLRTWDAGNCWVMKVSPDGAYIGAKQFGAYGFLGCTLQRIAIGADGSAVLVGNFGGSNIFDPAGTSPPVLPGGTVDSEIWASKFDKDFNYQWTTTMGSPIRDLAMGVAVTATGEAAVVGSRAMADTSAEIYVAKLTSAGAISWEFTATGARDNRANNVAFAPTGEMVVVGRFFGTLDFKEAGVRTAAGSPSTRDAFVLRLNGEGLPMWVKTFGGTSDDDAPAVGIQSNGTVLVAGNFIGTVDFNRNGPTPDIHKSGISADAYVTRTLADGTHCGAVVFGGGGWDGVMDLTVAPDDTFRVVGTYGGTADFNPSPLFTDTRKAVDGEDPFVSAFGSDGAYQWTWVGPGSEHGGIAIGMRLDGGVVLMGHSADASTPYDFDPDPDGYDTRFGDGEDPFFTSLSAK